MNNFDFTATCHVCGAPTTYTAGVRVDDNCGHVPGVDPSLYRSGDGNQGLVPPLGGPASTEHGTPTAERRSRPWWVRPEVDVWVDPRSGYLPPLRSPDEAQRVHEAMRAAVARTGRRLFGKGSA